WIRCRQRGSRARRGNNSGFRGQRQRRAEWSRLRLGTELRRDDQAAQADDDQRGNELPEMRRSETTISVFHHRLTVAKKARNEHPNLARSVRGERQRENEPREVVCVCSFAGCCRGCVQTNR